MRTPVLVLVALCACLPAWTDPPELSEVVVTATRVDTGLLASPSAVTLVTQDQIAASGAQDVSGVINGTAGVVVKDNGTTGGVKTVSIRGATSEQVLVLVDGIRVNSSIVGTVDLSTIPLSSVDHIEIVRGADSALYGSSAVGGVINIITKTPSRPLITLDVTNGSYIPHDAVEVTSTFPSTTTTPVSASLLDLVDNQTVDLSLAGKLGDVGLMGGGSFTRAANGFTWDDTTGIQAWRRLPNADALSGNGFVGLTMPLLGGELGVKGTVVLSDSGQPGSLTLVSDTARLDDTSATGGVTWKTDRFFTDALSLDLKTYYRYEDFTYNYNIPGVSASVAQTQTASLDLTQKLTLNDFLSAVYGGSASYDFIDSTDFTSTRDRLNVSGFLSVPLSPIEPLTITPSVRYDYFSDFAGNLSYSLSGVLSLSPRSSLRASFGSAYRVATLDEMYYFDPYGSYLSNPNLKPETSYNGELGWSLALDKVSVDTSVFTRLVYNAISNLEIAPYVFQVENLSETLFPGAEIHLKVQLIDTVSLEASYTLDDTFLLNDGTTAYTFADNRRAPYAPVNTVSAEARYTDKVMSGGIKLLYVGEQYTDTANSASGMIPGYLVLNADYRIALSGSVSLSLTAKNILDTVYYTQLGYPMPPFSLEAGMHLHV